MTSKLSGPLSAVAMKRLLALTDVAVIEFYHQTRVQDFAKIRIVQTKKGA
jgi:hypothetical protein